MGVTWPKWNWGQIKNLTGLISPRGWKWRNRKIPAFTTANIASVSSAGFICKFPLRHYTRTVESRWKFMSCMKLPKHFHSKQFGKCIFNYIYTYISINYNYQYVSPFSSEWQQVVKGQHISKVLQCWAATSPGLKISPRKRSLYISLFIITSLSVEEWHRNLFLQVIYINSQLDNDNLIWNPLAVSWFPKIKRTLVAISNREKNDKWKGRVSELAVQLKIRLKNYLIKYHHIDHNVPHFNVPSLL